MLYHFYDFFQRSMQSMHPFFELNRQFHANASELHANSYYHKVWRTMVAAGLDITKHYDKPAFNINKVMIDDDLELPVDEINVLGKPFCNLLHFKLSNASERPKVLLVTALSGHHATLCKGTVECLLPKFDLYVTDWKDARKVPVSEGRFGFDEYVAYLIEFMEFLGPNSHIIAICQPAVQALIATAVMAQRANPAAPSSLTLIAGPIDTRVNPNKVNEFANQYPLEWYERTLIHSVPYGYAGVGRKVYPGFLQLGSFISMNLSHHNSRYQSYYKNVFAGEVAAADRHTEFYDEYLAVLDLPAEFYMETMSRVFREHHLGEGICHWQGEAVDLGAISKTALFTIEAEDDDICSLGQTEAAQALCPNIPDAKRRTLIQPDVGHYGSFSGSKFRTMIAPQIVEFVKQHHKPE
jgi:poly(3-hydroxybutyrate) depolymerase